MDLTEVQAPPAAPAPSPAVLSDDQKFAIQEAVLQKVRGAQRRRSAFFDRPCA